MSVPHGSPGALGSNEGVDIEFIAEHMAPSLEVLRFYKSRVATFEKERSDFLQRLASVEVGVFFIAILQPLLFCLFRMMMIIMITYMCMGCKKKYCVFV
jgi:hypothetical protein